MSEEDYSELNKAIGLKSHGNGVGSFVYLRRIFERLIKYKIQEKFQGTDVSRVTSLRTKEKIESVKEMLLEFVLNNTALCSILSKGIHDLDEKFCISHFETLKSAILLILEEDYQRKRNESVKKEISNDINKIQQEFAVENK